MVMAPDIVSAGVVRRVPNCVFKVSHVAASCAEAPVRTMTALIMPSWLLNVLEIVPVIVVAPKASVIVLVFPFEAVLYHAVIRRAFPSALSVLAGREYFMRSS